MTLDEYIPRYMAIQETPYYKGNIRIETYPGAPMNFATAAGASISNSIVAITGTFQVVMGGLQFYHMGKPFGYGYDQVKRVISTDDNKILWQNRKEDR